MSKLLVGLLQGILALVVAYLVLAVLSTGVSSGPGHAKSIKAGADVVALADAVDRFYSDMRRYPSEEEGLSVLREFPAQNWRGWRGPYLKQDLTNDPWGNPYVYSLTEFDSGWKYTVTSFGADGKPGGSGDDADLSEGN